MGKISLPIVFDSIVDRFVLFWNIRSPANRMADPLYFSFHDIAAVEVMSESAFVRSFFNAEYGYHLASKSDDRLPLVRLNFQQGWEKNAGGYTAINHKLLADWSYRTELSPDKISHWAVGNRAAVPMVHHMAVHPSLRYLTAQRGTLLLHGGAVCKNGRSLIFTGRGGAGKTTTTALILSTGADWTFHADDYVFLQPEGRSLAYVTRSHLYRSLLKWTPEVATRLSRAERTRLQIFGLIREYSRDRIRWPVRISQAQLWPGRTIADEAIPAAILLLARGTDDRAELIPVSCIEEVTDELIEMNFGEARHFLNLLSKAGMLDAPWLRKWRETERGLLNQVLANTPVFRLILPQSGSAKVVRESLLPIVEDLVS